jgi:UDP-hydrolysing UDP-N-acetyl-D-glucosamine 2-epimerase
MRKICLVLTSRGNYAKMRSVIDHILVDDALQLQLIVGGGALLKKYGDIAKTITEAGISIGRQVHFLVEGETPVTMAKSAGLAVQEFSTAFDDLQPDVAVVIADRFECLPLAMTAAYMNIPIAHVEGGEVSGSIDESIRHAITKLAHIHFPATRDAAERIERLGEDPKTIYEVGATSLDVIFRMNLEDLGRVNTLQTTEGSGSIVNLNQPYLVVIQHPVTTEYEENYSNVSETIAAIEEIGMSTIWIWPNMDAGSDGISQGLREFLERRKPQYVHFFKGLAIEYYAPLLKNAKCLIGNSSSGIRESSALGVPVVNIGTRQQERNRGKNVIDVSYDRQAIRDAIVFQVQHGVYPAEYIYGDGQAGKRIVEVLKSAQFNLQKKITY